MDREVRYLMWWVAALPLCPAELRCSDSNFNNFDQFSISHPRRKFTFFKIFVKNDKDHERWMLGTKAVTHSALPLFIPTWIVTSIYLCPISKTEVSIPWLIDSCAGHRANEISDGRHINAFFNSLPTTLQRMAIDLHSKFKWRSLTWNDSEGCGHHYHIMEQRSSKMDRLIDSIRWFILAIDRDREITTTSWSILCITMIPSIKNLLTVIDVNEIWIRIKSELESESEKELESSIENVIGSLKPLLQNSLRPVNNVKLHRSITYIERLDLQKERLLGVGSVHSERFGLLATWHEDWRN